MQSMDANQEQCNCRGTLTPCLKTIRLYWCVYLLNVLRVNITHRCHAHTPNHASSLLPFSPFLFLSPPSLLSSPFFKQFFSFPVHSSLHQSCTHCCSLCISYLSSHSSLPPSLLLPSFLFRSLSFILAPPPPSGSLHVFSPSLYPFLLVLPSLSPQKQWTKDVTGW